MKHITGILSGLALMATGCAGPNFVAGTINNAVQHGDSVLIEGVDLTVSMSGSGSGKVQRIVILGTNGPAHWPNQTNAPVISSGIYQVR